MHVWLMLMALLVNVNDLRAEVTLNDEESRAAAFLAASEPEELVRANQQILVEWTYVTNITESTERAKVETSIKYAKFQKELWKRKQKFPWSEFKNEDLKRRFELASILGSAALSDEDYTEFEEVVSGMQSAWNRARICDFHQPHKCDVPLRPDIYELMANSRNEAELKHAWVEFRLATSNTTRPYFEKYVQLINAAAKANNFTDNTAMWLHSYECNDFREQLTKLWQQIKPLYLQLHAYVRYNLRKQYGVNVVSQRGPIPAHLLGHIHAQVWGNLASLMLPFPGHNSPDVTQNLVKQGYTVTKIFETAEEFFTSMGLSPMTKTFWNRSELIKPSDGREFECQASAWDFYDGEDFRIKQCTRITQDEFYTVHHEMGHVQYFLQYKDQPLIYRSGANPGFHEAVGDVISLSVSTPKHLRTIGLLDEGVEYSNEASINHLFLVALDKLSFIPSALMMDEWRWDVFEGRAQSDGYNCHWWKLREIYQGVEPTIDRSEDDFDPGSKYHIVANVPYIRYFVSFIIQFQFHRSLCQAAGHQGPLHECDIYRSKEAGNLLGQMLRLGSSKPWPDAMEMVTGQRYMDASAIREYFAPLETWLAAENARTGEFIGWERTKKRCVQTRDELQIID